MTSCLRQQCQSAIYAVFLLLYFMILRYFVFTTSSIGVLLCQIIDMHVCPDWELILDKFSTLFWPSTIAVRGLCAMKVIVVIHSLISVSTQIVFLRWTQPVVWLLQMCLILSSLKAKSLTTCHWATVRNSGTSTGELRSTFETSKTGAVTKFTSWDTSRTDLPLARDSNHLERLCGPTHSASKETLNHQK